MMGISREELELLDESSDQVYQHAFALLDAEEGITGNQAGEIAAQTAKTFRKNLYKLLEGDWASGQFGVIPRSKVPL